MQDSKKQAGAAQSRRGFLKGLAGAALVGAAAAPSVARADNGFLTVWSCGGLAEGMMPANTDYTGKTGINIAYTGARAGALGKSLLEGQGQTDVFCGRQLELAKQLRKAGKMLYFKPFCFTSYVIITPKGNPWNIRSLEDMAKPGLPIAMAPKASSPGGQAVTNLIKNAGLLEPIMANVLDKNATCVLRTVPVVTSGDAAAMIVERRVTKKYPRFQPLEVVDLPFEVMPKGPLTFTAGVMASAPDKAMADAYLEWLITDGQKHMDAAGFIPANTPEGQMLVEKLGVRDE